MTILLTAFPDFLLDARKLINDELRKFAPYSDCEELHLAIEYALFPGGKRLRPALTLSCGGMFGQVSENLLSIACAVELLHTASLVFDDLPAMDNTVSRHGKASLHREFSESTAILCAHSLVSLAFKTCSGLNLSSDNFGKIIYSLSEAIGPFGMASGQIEDLKGCEGTRAESSVKVAAQKTSGLFSSACYCGSLVQGASEKEAEILFDFGNALGLAFQIADDIHDAGREDDTAKSVNVVCACGNDSALNIFRENLNIAGKIAKQFDQGRQLLELIELVENYAERC